MKNCTKTTRLNQDFYNDLAQELITQICDKNISDGIVELKIKPATEILFAFNATDYTLQNGINSLNYLIIAFTNGIRCATDFDPQILEQLLD